MKKRNKSEESIPASTATDPAQRDLKPIFDDLEMVESSLHSSLKLRGYLENPRIPFAEKTAALRRIFKDYISAAAYDFLFLLIRSNALHLLTDIMRRYRLKPEQTGILELEVRTAVPLSPEEKEEISRRFSAKFNRPLVIRNIVDESIIAGMVVKTGDLMFDASLRTKMTSVINRLRKE